MTMVSAACALFGISFGIMPTNVWGWIQSLCQPVRSAECLRKEKPHRSDVLCEGVASVTGGRDGTVDTTSHPQVGPLFKPCV
jgi:hypothetical protein